MTLENKGRAGIGLAMILFGSIGVMVRQVDVESGSIAMVRAIAGTLILLLVLFGRIIKGRSSISAKRCTKSNLFWLMLSGIAIGFNWIFLFQAYRYTTIAVATLSYYFAPLFVILLSPLVLKERLTPGRILWLALALAGLFFIVLSEGNGITQLFVSSNNAINLHAYIGIGFGLLAALFYASVILITKRFNTLPGLEMTSIQLAAAALVLIPVVGLTDGFSGIRQLDLTGWLVLLILGVLHTGLAYYLYFASSRLVPGQTIAMFSYIDPACAIVFAAVFLREIPTPIQLLGGILILFATFMSETSKSKRQRDPLNAKSFNRDPS